MDAQAIIELQDALIKALDRQDVVAIEQATAALADATTQMRGQGTVRAEDGLLDTLNHAFRQNDAARARIHFLATHNRQKIDRLAALRGSAADAAYKKYNFAMI